MHCICKYVLFEVSFFAVRGSIPYLAKLSLKKEVKHTRLKILKKNIKNYVSTVKKKWVMVVKVNQHTAQKYSFSCLPCGFEIILWGSPTVTVYYHTSWLKLLVSKGKKKSIWTLTFQFPSNISWCMAKFVCRTCNNRLKQISCCAYFLYLFYLNVQCESLWRFRACEWSLPT